MHSVGHHLQKEAMSRGGDDLFARSAFNRYYYNLFLSVKVVISDFDSSYSELGHKDYPNILSGTMVREFKKIGTRARKLGDFDLHADTQKAVHAAKELAAQMTEANAVRIVADYYPDTKINFIEPGIRYSLNNYSITKAHRWGETSNIHIKTINTVLQQANA